MTLSPAIIWDAASEPPAHAGAVYRWNGYDEAHSMYSVLRYVEAHGDRLRQKYIGFIHELGEAQIKNRRLVEHLGIGNGLSLWWMSLLAEMSAFKSPRILDCLRLLALEEMLLERRPADVILASADKRLAEAIRFLCKSLGIRFKWQVEKKVRQTSVLRALYARCPSTLQALIYLARYLLTRWPLRKSAMPDWFQGNNVVFFFSYFFHLKPEQARVGAFHSRQWEGLPKFLHSYGVQTNFVHHFVYSPDIPNLQSARSWVEQFNKHPEQQGAHALLDMFLTGGVVYRAFSHWLRLIWGTPDARQVRSHFIPKGSRASLWPLLREDWHASFYGATAMMNLLWVELFNAAMKSLPHQKLGLYLCENQGWERAFINAWRTHGHGTLIAVPHATVRFWHLSYCNDPRTLTSRQAGAIPLPDKVAVNGKMAWDAYADSGYPIDQLVQVEALRFQYLNDDTRRSRQLRSRLPGANRSIQGQSRRVLILGDFTVAQTFKMLACIEAAVSFMGSSMAYTLKPHPVCKVTAADFPALRLELTDQPLAELVEEFDVAFASNTTSAGLDAYLSGLPVIIFLDGNDLNFSPLRGNSSVQFVSTAHEFARALTMTAHSSDSPVIEDFFWLDPGMPRWRRLLTEAGVPC
ncbi:MAG: hypothetical protein EPO06_08450 [Burkholderiaceae bacterium]|nr:MAG: hypothetical protein EPO06_08450 [Burkholderiaceae bacterium]